MHHCSTSTQQKVIEKSMVEKIRTDPEICDEWWILAKMNEFARNTQTYPTTCLEEILIVPISEIEPAQRSFWSSTV